MRESVILREIRAVLNKSGRARVVRNTGGFDGERKIRYGLGVGSPDLVGVLKDGRAFCVEVKRPGGRLAKKQDAWWRAARKWNVLGGVATSVDEALKLLPPADLPPAPEPPNRAGSGAQGELSR